MYPRGDAELSSSNLIFNFFYKFQKTQNLEKFWKQILKTKIFIPRELGNNQIRELPPGVFNNNTELIKLYVIDFLGSSYDSLWCAKRLVSLLTKCDQEGPDA